MSTENRKNTWLIDTKNTRKNSKMYNLHNTHILSTEVKKTMNKKKILILVILTIFIVGMVMGAASASHTFKKGKYKAKVSDKTYKQIKNGKKIFVKKVGTKNIKNGKYIKSEFKYDSESNEYRVDYYKITKTEKIPVYMHVCKNYKGKIVIWLNNHMGRGL